MTGREEGGGGRGGDSRKAGRERQTESCISVSEREIESSQAAQLEQSRQISARASARCKCPQTHTFSLSSE